MLVLRLLTVKSLEGVFNMKDFYNYVLDNWQFSGFLLKQFVFIIKLRTKKSDRAII